MKKPQPFVITISRMLGSGGAYIGQQLAKELNILYLDREITCEAAKKLNLNKEDIEVYDEKTTSLGQLFIQASMFVNPYVYVAPKYFIPSDKQLHEVEVEIIKKAVMERSAVVIGRGGSHIFRDYPRHISVFLHGDLEFRKKRVEDLYILNEKDALKRINESDGNRSRFYKTFTGNEFADARQYNICRVYATISDSLVR